MLYHWCSNYILSEILQTGLDSIELLKKNLCLECSYAIDGPFKKYGEQGLRRLKDLL